MMILQLHAKYRLLFLRKNLNNIIQRAKKYFYKIYEDSVEQMYIALPAGAVNKANFKQGVPHGTGKTNETITNKNQIS